MLDKGRVTRRILPYLPEDLNEDSSHYGRYRATTNRDGEWIMVNTALRIDRE
jgi:hypothetical protein